MKTIILLLLTPLLGLNSIQKLDEDNGFGNYKFGSSQQAFKNLTLEIGDGDFKLYSTSSVDLNVKDTKFKYVRLTFFKNKLSGISIQTTGSSGNNLFAYFNENYSSPKKIKENYEWISKKVQLVYEPLGKDAAISFYSREKNN